MVDLPGQDYQGRLTWWKLYLRLVEVF